MYSRRKKLLKVTTAILNDQCCGEKKSSRNISRLTSHSVERFGWPACALKGVEEGFPASMVFRDQIFCEKLRYCNNRFFKRHYDKCVELKGFMLVSNRSLFPSSKRQQPISIFLT